MKKSKSDKESIFLSYLIVCFVGTIPIVDFGNISQILKNQHVFWITLSSIAQLFAFYALLVGFKRADLGRIVHIEYTGVIFATAYSFLFFNTYPTLFEILGSLLIFAGILFKLPKKSPLGLSD